MSGLHDAPEQAAEQMREATDRLRERSWMVAPLTTPVSDLVIDLTDSEANVNS